MSSMTGTVTIVQEGRFQMTDDDGVSHLFILHRNGRVETAQLADLRHRQARIRVQYHAASSLIANVVNAVTLLD